MNSYDQLVERVAKSANLAREEIERKVEAKRAKLSGLISKEGAAQIVAAELGIVFDSEKLKVGELADGMKRAHVVAKIVQLYPVRSYNKNGKEGKVANLVIADETSNAKVVLWDTNHIALVENNTLKEGDVVEISNGNVRSGEIHLSAFGDIKKSNQVIENVKTERNFAFSSLKDAKPGQNIKARGIILQLFEPRYFDAKNSDEKRALVNLLIDDGSGTMRCVLFGDHIPKLGFTYEEIFSLDLFETKRKQVLGEEMIFSGNVRTNSFFNLPELHIQNVEPVDVSTLIAEYEAKLAA